jgi:hypothetical protein
MNSQVFIEGVSLLNDQLDSNNGRRSHSITLDTIAALPAEGPIRIQFAQNFDATADPFESLTVYVDNIRLIDTYAAGAKAVVYPLQSFESAEDPIGGAANFTGWGGGTRTTYSQYTKADAEDPRVTDGTKSLKVDYAGTGGWGSDFTLPFAGTKLAEVLKLDLPAEERPARESLIRYTLQFDVIYPERADDWTADWINTSFHTQQDGFPFSQSGNLAPLDTRGLKKTLSITLDQLSWADWTDPKPSVMFIANGAWGPSGTAIYYDNFRLIDTGEVSTPPASPRITSFGYTAANSTITMKWESVTGKKYTIERTENLGSWPNVVVADIPGSGGEMQYQGAVPAATRGFFRVRVTD